MTIAMVESKIPYIAGLPRDVSENVFWGDFATGLIAPTHADQLTGWAAAIASELFNHVGTAGLDPFQSIASMYADFCNRTTDGCMMRCYEVDETTYPATGSSVHVADVPWTLGPAGTGVEHSLPSEVALCVTLFSGDTSVPSRSRHGRLYFGPLLNEVSAAPVGEAAPYYARPQVYARDIVNDSCSNLHGWSTTNIDERIQWRLFSRKHKQMLEWQGASCADEWAVQRRRGMDPTSRVTVLF